MKKTLLILFLSALMTHSGRSQCVGTCSVYAVSQITYTAFPSGSLDVTPSFTNPFIVGLSNDDGSIGPIPIGFNFNYYCNTYSNVHICSNGFIMLDYQAFPWPTQYVHPTQNFPDPTLPNGMIAFNMTDLYPSSAGGTITYTTVGISPNRMFIVTYSNVPCFTTLTDLNTGQIVLYETTNIIEIHTASAKPDLDQGTLGGTQGIEDITGALGVTPPGRNANNTWGANANNTAFRFAPYTALPPASLTGNTLICQGTSANYQASFIPSASSYNWTLPSGWVGTSTISALMATAGSSGNFTVTATYTCGTSVPAILNVSVNPSPVVSLNNPTPPLICSGKTTTITCSGATSYTLNPGGFNGTPPFVDMPLATTIYTLTGTNSFGCVSVNSATTSITVYDTPLISVNSGSICLGKTFTISPVGPANFAVTGNFFSVSPPTPGPYSYTVVGTSTNGCVSDPAVSALTVFSLPTVGIVASRTVICLKETAVISGTGGTSYVWGNSSANPSITVSPTTNTFYTITGTDNHGCTNTATLNFTVKLCTGIEELTGDKWTLKYTLIPATVFLM